MTFKVIEKMSNNYFFSEVSNVIKSTQYDELTFGARFWGIGYIYPALFEIFSVWPHKDLIILEPF